MNKWMVLLALALTLAVVPAATAQGGGKRVIKTGSCTGGATWTLKVKSDDGRLDTEFEVDQNRNGRKWHAVLKQNGSKVASVFRRTHAPSGSFSLERLVDNKPGTDTIVGRATALADGQICRGVVRF